MKMMHTTENLYSLQMMFRDAAIFNSSTGVKKFFFFLSNKNNYDNYPIDFLKKFRLSSSAFAFTTLLYKTRLLRRSPAFHYTSQEM